MVQHEGMFAAGFQLKLAQKCDKAFRSDFRTGFGTHQS